MHISLPCVFSIQVPFSAPFGRMMTHTPSIRFLSSRDPVDIRRVTLPTYAGPVVSTSPDVMMLLPAKLHATTQNDVSGGITAVDFAVPPTVWKHAISTG